MGATRRDSIHSTGGRNIIMKWARESSITYLWPMLSSISSSRRSNISMMGHIHGFRRKTRENTRAFRIETTSIIRGIGGILGHNLDSWRCGGSSKLGGTLSPSKGERTSSLFGRDSDPFFRDRMG